LANKASNPLPQPKSSRDISAGFFAETENNLSSVKA